MKRRLSQRGVTLLELLVALAILGVVLLIIGHAMSLMQNTWVKIRGKADGFRNTRLALDTVTQRLSQATLNSRWKIDAAQPNNLRYVPDSDLHFVSGKATTLLNNDSTPVGDAVFFQAPFGQDAIPQSTSSTTPPLDTQSLEETLNAWGYFVEFGSDADERPDFMVQSAAQFPPRQRFRLLEFRQPAHELTLFDLGTAQAPGQAPGLLISQANSFTQLYTWFRTPLAAGSTYQQRRLTVIAENVLAIIVTPLDPKLRDPNAPANDPSPYLVAPDGTWDSRRFQTDGSQPVTPGTATPTPSQYQWHRLPPAIQLTAIAMSEDSWAAIPDEMVGSTANQLRTLINGLFNQGSTLENDLTAVQTQLDAMTPPMRYKIVSILIPMAGQ